MKSVLLSYFSIFFLSFSVSARSSLVWSDLNDSMVDIVEEHVDMYDFLESGQVIFNESGSDLSSGQLSLEFLFKSSELNLLSTPNSQRINIVGDLNINTTSAGSFKKVDFQASVEIQGELLLVLNHINQLFGDCQQIDPEDDFQIEFCKYTNQVKQAKSAKELVSALESLQKAILYVVSSDPKDPFRMLIESLQIVQKLDSVLVSLLVNNLEVFGLKLSGDLSLSFTDKGLIINITGSTLLNAQDYSNFQTQLESLLIGLKNKDQGVIDLFSGYSYFLFDLLEGIFL